jgi:hypothetical protein
MTQLPGQKRKIEEIQSRKRRKIAVNAQMTFADIESIKKAKDKEQEEYGEERPIRDAQGRPWRGRQPMPRWIGT